MPEGGVLAEVALREVTGEVALMGGSPKGGYG